jgi:site-specific recombinase
LMAGWVENWVIVNQVPKRIKYHDKLRLILGVKRCENLSVFISENANAWAANIGLGLLLGFVPQISKFLGLGLDVRHVTLSTGSFAAALPSVLEIGIDVWTLINSVLGILVIGLLNISVSFVLAFLLASTSSRVKFSSFVKLFRSSLRLLLSRPWLLFVPEKK